MINSRKEIMDIVQELHRQGWRSRLGSHVVLFPADKTQRPVMISYTPTDSRWRQTMLTKLRRAGAKI